MIISVVSVLIKVVIELIDRLICFVMMISSIFIVMMMIWLFCRNRLVRLIGWNRMLFVMIWKNVMMMISVNRMLYLWMLWWMKLKVLFWCCFCWEMLDMGGFGFDFFGGYGVVC